MRQRERETARRRQRDMQADSYTSTRRATHPASQRDRRTDRRRAEKGKSERREREVEKSKTSGIDLGGVGVQLGVTLVLFLGRARGEGALLSTSYSLSSTLYSEIYSPDPLQSTLREHS